MAHLVVELVSRASKGRGPSCTARFDAWRSALAGSSGSRSAGAPPCRASSSSCSPSSTAAARGHQYRELGHVGDEQHGRGVEADGEWRRAAAWAWISERRTTLTRCAWTGGGSRGGQGLERTGFASHQRRPASTLPDDFNRLAPRDLSLIRPLVLLLKPPGCWVEGGGGVWLGGRGGRSEGEGGVGTRCSGSEGAAAPTWTG